MYFQYFNKIKIIFKPKLDYFATILKHHQSKIHYGYY